MFDQVLFPTDGGEGASAALEHVLDIAAAHDATVHVLHVADTNIDSVTRVGGEVVDVLEREGEGIVREAAERAGERGVETVTEVLQGEPYSTIVDYAGSRGIDLVVMPTRGRRGLERFLLGSTTERVVRESDVPVLTLRPAGEPPAYPYRDVLVATDGSDGARAALRVGVDVANGAGATLHVLSVVDTASLGVDVRTDIQTDAMRESANEVVEEATAFATDAGVESVSGTVEEAASVHRAIRSYVEDHDVDLVVAGTHGRSGLDRYVLGSVAERLVRTSPVPVLTVRRPADGA
jgi:nucleotide-binding universal stress UspA family protein